MRLDPGFGVGVKFRNRNDAGVDSALADVCQLLRGPGTGGGLSRQCLDLRNTNRGVERGAVLATGGGLERRVAW